MLTRRFLLIATAALALPTAAEARKKRAKHPAKAEKTKLKPDSAIPLMHDLAMHHQHGSRDEGKPIADLVTMYRAGQIIACICGSISHTGVALLREAGYAARVVGVVTQLPFNGIDGHIMIEVWDQGAWRLYCIDGNRRAVDARGRGINLEAQVAAGTNRIWEPIADDPISAPDNVPDNRFTRQELDDRVFGTPWIVLGDDATEAFHDATDRSRLDAMGLRYLDKAAWARLTDKP